jgi:hypothetical protein
MDAVYRNRSVGFGDELTAQLVSDDKIGKGGVEASAKSPTSVLRLIEDYKKENDGNPDILKDKTIFLSTGFENSDGSTKDFDTVLKQISTLKSLGASDNAIKILGVSEKAKNATEINDGLKKIAAKNDNEYLPVANKKKLGRTFVSKAMSGKATLPAASADADDQRLGEAIASNLASSESAASGAETTSPTPASSAGSGGDIGEFQAADAAASGAETTSPIPMSEQDTYTADSTDNADSNIKPESSSTQSPLTSSGDDPTATTLSQESPKDKAKDLTPVTGDEIGEFQAADVAATPSAQESVSENKTTQLKLPIDDPYNDQHPQFNSLIKRLANEYGVPAI